MTMQLGADGYYYMVPGDGTPYYYGSDGKWHPVIRIQDTTGTFNEDPNHAAIFLNLMMQHNNSFRNDAGELVEFTRAIVVTGLHVSSALADTYSYLGISHYGIQLTNDHLFMNDGSTHMYHFRPERPEASSFYPAAWTRKQISKNQNKAHSHKNTKGNKKDPPSGGGHSTKSDSSKGSSSKGSSSKDSTSKDSSSKGSSSKSSASKTGSSKRHPNKAGHFRLSNDDDYDPATAAAPAGNMSHLDKQLGNSIFSAPRLGIHDQQAANATHGPSIDRPEVSTYVTGLLFDVTRLCLLMLVLS
ncbi:hypothetical protein MGU_06627 [Metarhizium guizhouense ARSEF 977]|uniref:Uncharacterized protein n=1 Tax=Metarhizium guizhouense (strain ARSEF 977) TaxID=1276136 RepID=A0A0B4I1I2_METGA|nr:hypothetical protein MGU_06627 [Metarhizium guizhouense ARSEF 977]